MLRVTIDFELPEMGFAHPWDTSPEAFVVIVESYDDVTRIAEDTPRCSLSAAEMFVNAHGKSVGIHRGCREG